jgi:hypothetical protein
VNDGPVVEVLGHGDDAGRLRAARAPLPTAVRAVAYIALGAVGVGALWLTAGHRTATAPPAPSAASAAALAQTQTVYPTPVSAGLGPPAHELTVSTAPGQRSFIAFSTHILLFVHLTYTGSAQVRVVDGRVPQDGAYPDAGAGGLTAGTTANVALRRGVPTEVFVRTRVECPQVLAGTPVNHLELVTQASGQPPRAQLVDLARLGAYWDEARHAACTRPDAASALTVGVDVSTMVGSPGRPGARPWVDVALSLHNADGFDALAVVSRAASPGVILLAAALTTDGADVEGGATFLTRLRWVVGSCALARAGGPPPLDFQVTVADSGARLQWADDVAFAAAWRVALDQACP